MYHPYIIWDDPQDLTGNVSHVAEHDISPDEVEDVLLDPDASTEVSRSSPERSITFGETATGRYLAVVWQTECDDPLMIYPITAYPVPRPRLE